MIPCIKFLHSWEINIDGIIIEQDIKVCLLSGSSGAAINQAEALKFSSGTQTSALIKRLGSGGAAELGARAVLGRGEPQIPRTPVLEGP